MSETTPEPPVLRIVSGQPEDADIAAVTIALTSLASTRGTADTDETDRPASVWADRAAGLRRNQADSTTPRPGAHAWRTSTLPR